MLDYRLLGDAAPRQLRYPDVATSLIFPDLIVHSVRVIVRSGACLASRVPFLSAA